MRQNDMPAISDHVEHWRQAAADGAKSSAGTTFCDCGSKDACLTARHRRWARYRRFRALVQRFAHRHAWHSSAVAANTGRRVCVDDMPSIRHLRRSHS